MWGPVAMSQPQQQLSGKTKTSKQTREYILDTNSKVFIMIYRENRGSETGNHISHYAKPEMRQTRSVRSLTKTFLAPRTASNLCLGRLLLH